MDSDLEYIHEHYVELSDGSSNKEDYTNKTAMIKQSLKAWRVRRSMFSISRVPSRIIKCSTAIECMTI